MMSRFLLTEAGCPFCRDATSVITRINLRLPADKRINIIDCTNWEQFGIMDKPIMKKLEKEGFNYYPFLYLEGQIIEPAPTPEMLKKVIEVSLKEDLLY